MGRRLALLALVAVALARPLGAQEPPCIAAAEQPLGADSLAALGKRYPESSLAPRALFMKAEIEADAGGAAATAVALRDAARADFAKLAETWPLHDLAPRSLEQLAELEGRDNPGEAVAEYGRLMERYPDYPFIERVRERYIALGKTAGAEAPKKGSK